MSQAIGPDGCLPRWPPVPWPPAEPPPSEEDLHLQVEWMTYAHRDLYVMATTKLDVAGANAVAAEWAKLGEALSEIGDELATVVRVSDDGWRGEAAELARETGRRLGKWSAESSVHAMSAGGCVTRHSANAEWARNAMPEPLGFSIEGVPPDFRDEKPIEGGLRPQPRDDGGGGMPASDGGTSPMSAGGGTSPMSASSFTSGDFSTGPDLITDPGPERDEKQQRHRRAAEVMRELQYNSVEVYGSVPEFRPPDDDWVSGPGDGEDGSEDRPPRDGPDEKPDDGDAGREDDGDTSTSSTAPITGGGAGAAAVVTGREIAGGLPPGSVALGPGDQTGVRGGGVTSAPGSAAPAAASTPTGGGAPRGPGFAGMPMGAAGAGAQRGEDQERKPPGYLSGDGDAFRPDETEVPPWTRDDRTQAGDA